MGLSGKDSHFALTIANEHFLGGGGRWRTALCSSFSGVAADEGGVVSEESRLQRLRQNGSQVVSI